VIHALGNHLWQSTVFAVLIAALCWILRRDGAPIRFWLWWMASVKFLVPFALLTWLGTWLSQGVGRGLVPETWTNTVTVVAHPFAEASAGTSIGALLIGIWAAGSVLLLAAWIVRALRLRRIVRAAEQAPAPLSFSGRQIPVHRTRARIEPCAIGLLRSALLLPADLETRLDSRQVDAVLAHELCHVQRRDNLTAAIHMLVETLFWFHPLVWWIGSRLVRERENACDEMVIASGHDPETYAESILDVCEHFVLSPLPCAAGISGCDLRQRITRIMRYRPMNKLKLSKKILLVLAAFVVVAIPTLDGISAQNVARAQDATPEPGAPPSESAAPAPTVVPGSADGDYVPIVMVQPIYPTRALARGLEGWVVVQYTITETGATEDVVVTDSSSMIFENAAVESAGKYKYKPRVVNGQPVATPGVHTRIEFALSGSQQVDPSPNAEPTQ
jgi:TonB family protein